MRVAVVVNPARVRHAARFRAVLDGELTARGLPPARYLPTTVAGPGAGQPLAAVDDGAHRVLVAGGDGTVRMVLGALRDTGVPVGLLPVGTGNLLARNLRLPLRLRPAVEAALDGGPHPLDLIRYTDLETDAQGFAAVMAGLGADAAVIADASEPLKRLGRLSYLLAGLRHLRARPVRTRVAVDSDVLVRDASLVGIGNVGELTRGLQLFPHAAGDDGVLDALVAAPRHTADVAAMIAGVALRTRTPRVDRRQGRDIVIHCERPVPCQADGDLLGPVTAIRFEVRPGAASILSPERPPRPRPRRTRRR